MRNIQFKSFTVGSITISFKKGINYLLVNDYSYALKKMRYALGLNESKLDVEEKIKINLLIGEEELQINRVPNSKELKISTDKKTLYLVERSTELADFYSELLKPWFFMKGYSADIFKILDLYFYDSKSEGKYINKDFLDLLFGFSKTRVYETHKRIADLKEEVEKLEKTFHEVEKYTSNLVDDFTESQDEKGLQLVKSNFYEYRKKFESQVHELESVSSEFKEVKERLENVKKETYKIFYYELSNNSESMGGIDSNLLKLDSIFYESATDGEQALRAIMIVFTLLQIEKKIKCNTPGFFFVSSLQGTLDRKLNKSYSTCVNNFFHKNTDLQYIEFIKDNSGIESVNVLSEKGVL